MGPPKTEDQKKQEEEERKAMEDEQANENAQHADNAKNVEKSAVEIFGKNGGDGKDSVQNGDSIQDTDEKVDSDIKEDNPDKSSSEPQPNSENQSEKPTENGDTVQKLIEDEIQQPATPEPLKDQGEIEDMQNDENIIMHDEDPNKAHQNFNESNAPEIDIPIPDYYNVNIEHQNSGYLITYGIVAPHKMVVRVTLTSTLLRKDIKQKEEDEQKKHEEMIA